VKFQATFMISLRLGLVIVSLITITSLIGYIFVLLCYVGVIILWITYVGFITELISLMILLVYVGAMAVLFIYVRAVSPNSSYNFTSYNLIFILFSIIVLIGGLTASLSILPFYSISLVDVSGEMFTGLGIYLTLVVVLVLVIVLAAVTFISPASSTFRSIN